MKFDLDLLAGRVAKAAERSKDLLVSVSSFDLIFRKDDHGASRSESVPFAALFLTDKDLLAEALDRLEAGPE